MSRRSKLVRDKAAAGTRCDYCGSVLEAGDAVYRNPRNGEFYGVYCHIDWSKPKFRGATKPASHEGFNPGTDEKPPWD